MKGSNMFHCYTYFTDIHLYAVSHVIKIKSYKKEAK